MEHYSASKNIHCQYAFKFNGFLYIFVKSDNPKIKINSIKCLFFEKISKIINLTLSMK